MVALKLILFVNGILLLLCRNTSALFVITKDNDTSIAERLSFIFYKESINNSVSIRLPEGQTLSKQDGFDPNKLTVFFAAGYTNPLNNTLSQLVLQGYLSQKDKYNVLQINYTYYSMQKFLISFPLIPKVSKVIADQLRVMIDDGVLREDRIHLVGRSLGGQLVGNIAKYVKVPLLVGLDPAGPGFNVLLPKMEKGFANYTIIIHSDAGVYGTTQFNGDVNYAPHDGVRYQPGCSRKTIPFSFTEIDVCSHHRSVEIWGNALLNPNIFKAVPCKYKGYCRESCDLNNPVYISPETRVFGTYYLETSESAPFGLGEDGIRHANENLSGNFIYCDVTEKLENLK